MSEGSILLDLIRKYRPEHYARRKGRGRIVHVPCLCGQRTDSDPSFAIYTDRDNYKCYILGCPHHGGVREMMALLNITDEDIHIRARERPAPSPYESGHISTPPYIANLIHDAWQFYVRQLWERDGEVGVAYLRARGLNDETIQTMGIGWASPNHTIEDLMAACSTDIVHLALSGLIGAHGKPIFRGRVIFPIGAFERGEVAYLVGRGVQESVLPRYLGLRRSLAIRRPYRFGVPERGVVLVEGIMDAAACVQAGITKQYAVIATLGAPNQRDMNVLVQWLAKIRKPVYLFFDRDQSGAHMAMNLAMQLSRYRVPMCGWLDIVGLAGYASLPLSFDDVKDLGDLLKTKKESLISDLMNHGEKKIMDITKQREFHSLLR